MSTQISFNFPMCIDAFWKVVGISSKRFLQIICVWLWNCNGRSFERCSGLEGFCSPLGGVAADFLGISAWWIPKETQLDGARTYPVLSSSRKWGLLPAVLQCYPPRFSKVCGKGTIVGLARTNISAAPWMFCRFTASWFSPLVEYIAQKKKANLEWT